MLADLVLELASAPATGTVTLPGVAPQGRLTWASQFVVRSTVLYVLNDLTQEEWGFGTFIPGTPATLTRDVVLGNSAGTTAPLNFAGSTRCYSALPSAYLLSVLGKNVGRNLFHNPMFTVAQRGSGPFTPVGYTPGMLDRWQCEPGAAGSRTISQVALSDADRAAIGDEEASFALQYAVTGAAGVNDYDMLVQNIEFVRRTAGKAVTVSLWASASAAGLKVGIGCVQVFGGAGASGSVALNAVPQTLTTGWARYSATFAVPNAQGKILATPPDFFRVRLWLSSGANNNGLAGNIGVQSGTVRFWGMQCEIGPIATPLEKPAPEYDLSNCLRHFQAHNSLLCVAYANGAGSLVYQDFVLPVTMRAQPSATFSGISYVNASALVTGAAVGPSHMRFRVTASAGPGLSYAIFSAQLSAEF